MTVNHLRGRRGDPWVDEDALFAIAVTEVRLGKAVGLDYRLADAPEEGHVRLVGGAATVGLGDHHWGGDRLQLDQADLQALARLGSAWKVERISWAAYVGHGHYSKFLGYSRFLHFAPGRAGEVEIPFKDPRLPRFVEGADRYRLLEPEPGQRLGGCRVRHRLASGLDEPAGVVVDGPGRRCSVAVREGLLVAPAPPRDPGDYAPVARWLIRRSHVTTDLPRLAREGIELDSGLVALIVEAAGAGAA